MGQIKPILFSTPMVQAIMDGRKSMTRRVIKPQPDVDGLIYEPQLGEYVDTNSMIFKAKYNVGDILWVRETWQSFFQEEVTQKHERGPESSSGIPAEMAKGHYMYYFYRADGEIPLARWEPSIYMPKKAARLFLRVTNVRAERLQDMSYDDCLKEGMWDYGTDVDTLAAFQALWDGLNAKRGYGWDTNPWVWVYTFERCDKPEGWCV